MYTGEHKEGSSCMRMGRRAGTRLAMHSHFCEAQAPRDKQVVASPDLDGDLYKKVVTMGGSNNHTGRVDRRLPGAQICGEAGPEGPEV